MFGRNNENDVVNQNDLFSSSDTQSSSEPFELRDDPNEEQNLEENKVVETNKDTNQFGFDEFMQMFAEGKQEEVILSEKSIQTIKEDIILEKPKEKFKISYVIIGIIFIALLFASIFISYVASTYSLVWGYNVAEAKYYFDTPKVSVTLKNDYCNTDYLKKDMNILYTEGDVNMFTKFKQMKIVSINSSTISGIDYDTGSNKTIPYEYVYYIIDE